MRWSGALILSLLALLYFLLSQSADGLLAGFGYACAALLIILAILNLIRPHK